MRWEIRTLSRTLRDQRLNALERRLPVQILGGPALTLPGDATQIKPVLIDLLKNAGEAALDQGAEGQAHAAVRLVRRKSTAAAELLGEDDGPGIAQTTNRFVPFFPPKPGGSGSGLVRCCQIAENHGGTLALANRPGHPGASPPCACRRSVAAARPAPPAAGAKIRPAFANGCGAAPAAPREIRRLTLGCGRAFPPRPPPHRKSRTSPRRDAPLSPIGPPHRRTPCPGPNPSAP